MLQLRTEAESLARAPEAGLIDVADAVHWADQEIAVVDVPHNVLCDVSMSSRAYPQDVARLLRGIPEQFDRGRASVQVLRLALDALTSGRRSPECVAHALFELAIADDIPPGRLRDGAFWYWDALDMAREGYIPETTEEIVGTMTSTLSQVLDDAGNCPIT